MAFSLQERNRKQPTNNIVIKNENSAGYSSIIVCFSISMFSISLVIIG